MIIRTQSCRFEGTRETFYASRQSGGSIETEETMEVL